MVIDYSVSDWRLPDFFDAARKFSRGSSYSVDLYICYELLTSKAELLGLAL